MEDERQPFRRGQRLEHDQQRKTDRVGEHRLVLRIAALDGVDDRVGQMDVQRLLAARLACAEHVQRHAGDHGRQPAAEVLDVARVGAAESKPGVLDRVVGLAERPEHPIGDRPQVGPVLAELPGEPFLLLVHVTSLFSLGSLK